MAVSKIAVIALVAVIAVPILLGYALNLSESTETGYKTEGESVNVTSLLQNGTGHTVVHSDVYNLNVVCPDTAIHYENIVPNKTTYYMSSNGQMGWADLSGGLYFFNNHSIPDQIWTGLVNLPHNTNYVLLTINLDSVEESDFSFDIERINPGIRFVKETINNEVKWYVEKAALNSDYHYDLYYDPERTDNTYQLLINSSNIGLRGDGFYDYSLSFTLRYVGSWPTIIGLANYYHEYTIPFGILGGTYNDTLSVVYRSGGGEFLERSLTIRLDDALYPGMEYPIIEDKTYSPSDFKTNPSTLIKNITHYGDSITFSGVTYDVDSDGKITIDSHKIPVNGIILSSVPNESGTFDNKIGNTLISSSLNPSTITFNGEWSADVITSAQDSYTQTKTEWNAGSFAWDGMDQNFLIVGLITCLGVFIALGIYARKSRSGGIIPLMIVTGCAAALFFILI